jgi:hypothetical protein
MRRLLMLLALVVPTEVAAAKPALPKKDVLKVVKAAVADAKSVTDVFADIGDGRFPILFTSGGKDCISRTIDHQKDESCSPVTRPHVGIVRKAADGTLALEAELALPTEAAPWDVPEEMKWGINIIKDFDGDGKPELMLAYGYHGPSYWAVGDTWYKHWCILNLDKLAPAICVVVDQLPQAGSEPHVESKWKLLPAAAGAAPDIEIARSETMGDDKPRQTTRRFRWERTSDTWGEVK